MRVTAREILDMTYVRVQSLTVELSSDLARRLVGYCAGGSVQRVVIDALTSYMDANPKECPAEHHSVWDGEHIDLFCGLSAGHPGPHSADAGEWEWEQ